MSFNARHWETHTPSMESHWRAEEAAKLASEQLYDAMRAQFIRFAAQHGVTVKDAQLFCMNGEGL